MYPSWPAIENLWRIDFTSAGNFLRSTCSGATCPDFEPFVFEVLSGCAPFELSLYIAIAFNPIFQASRYVFITSSIVADSGKLTVLEIAPEINGCAAAII